MNEGFIYTILNVDDDEPSRYAKTRILQRAGYQVVEAKTGAEALRLVQERSPHLVLLDVILPDINGIEVCRRIKTNSNTGNTMVLQVSASSLSTAAKVESLDGGADSYLTEPVEAEELVANVKALLRLYQRERENRELLAKVRESEERLRLAQISANIGVWDWNVKSNQVTWTPELELLYGLSAGSFGGTYEHWRRRVHPEDVADAERKRTEAIRNRRPFDVEFRVFHSSGEVRWISSKGGAFYDDTGEAVRVLGVHIDITGRKRLEEQLREHVQHLRNADRIKDEFLATLAHELRNPLAPIRNAVEILRVKGPSTPELEWARKIIDQQMKQVIRLLDELLDVSRITRDRLELRKELVELAKVIESAVETSRPLIEQYSHRVTVSLPPDPVYVEADEVRLSQVFSNLLNNAAKYTEPGGQIWITAALYPSPQGGEGSGFYPGPLQSPPSPLAGEGRVRGTEAVVTVKDTGVGIPADQLSYVFEMFAQIDRTLEQTRGGLGVGLTLVKRLVQLHGGRIAVKSEGPGKGSEFMVCLPIVVERPEAGALSSPVNGQSALPFAPVRILIVDDNRVTASSLAVVLRTMGHEIRSAYDGEEAFSAAEEFQPNVALLDIGLPKLNGYDVCRRIRQQRWGKGMVLIALTGWGREEDRRNAHDAGFDYHMVKPVDPESVMKVLSGPARIKGEAV
ncbi:MAG: response regulator [Candidatus Binatia bacterium]